MSLVELRNSCEDREINEQNSLCRARKGPSCDLTFSINISDFNCQCDVFCKTYGLCKCWWDSKKREDKLLLLSYPCLLVS